jgi:hypothetical protein
VFSGASTVVLLNLLYFSLESLTPSGLAYMRITLTLYVSSLDVRSSFGEPSVDLG